MKTNALKIGNYVQDNMYIYQICAIEENNIKGCIKELYNDNNATTENYYKEGNIYLNIENIYGVQLTEEWLLKFEFEKMKCITFDYETEWVKKPNNYYDWWIGVLLGNYPETNPNCGCVSIVHKNNEKVSAVPKDLYNKEKWTKDDIKRAENHTVTYKKWRQPIAYYIKYVHLLQNLYFALCNEELIIKTNNK